MSAIYGQSDAVAVAVVALLNQYSAAFILPVTAARVFARKLDIGSLPNIGQPVMIQVIPGAEHADLKGLSQTYDDTYGCTLILLQNVADVTNGGLSEAQMALLLQLRSQIIERLCMTPMTCANAVHPFYGALLKGVRSKGMQGNSEGVYDLEKLESDNVFYSATSLIYPAAGPTRRTIS